VYCVNVKDFEGLRVETVEFGQELLEKWAGPHNFRWRIKIETLADVLRKYGEPTIIIDGDTYFRRSPDHIFKRIKPGRAVMHIREGRVCDLQDETHKDMKALLRSGEIHDPSDGAAIPATQAMWNAGVVGVDASDLRAVEEATILTDHIVTKRPVETAEQFSLSYCLEKPTRLHSCEDAVFHYWSMRYRRPFRANLHRILEDTAPLPEAERSKVLYTYRPRSSRRKKILNAAIRVLDLCGVRLYSGSPRQSV
jgi:hypothetical protein